MLKKYVIDKQINICQKIIENIENKQYRNASVLIRYYLNDSRFIWYKKVNLIIENQITNLFLDIETDFKNNYTINFFKHIINDLEYLKTEKGL